MSELRQRKDAKPSKKAAKHSTSSEHDCAHTDAVVEADGVPVVAAVSSAFDAADDESAPSPAAPGEQSMDDDDDTSPSDAAVAAAAAAARMHISPTLRSVFEKRRDELLEKHPDIMTREYAVEDDGPMCRFDLLMLSFLACLLFYVLYLEYGINVPAIVGGVFQRMLDPGTIQREPIISAADLEASARDTIDAAVRAVQERMQNTK